MGPWYGEWCILTATSWNTGRGDEVIESFDQQIKWLVSEDDRWRPLGGRQSELFQFSSGPLMSRTAKVVDYDRP
jgi:hypothetical protein